MRTLLTIVVLLAQTLPAIAAPPNLASYPWLESAEGVSALEERFRPPQGYERTAAPPSSFGHWARGLPLEPGRPEVLLFDGRKKPNQTAQLAVLRIDVGTRDLQQCADAAIRLWAEYLWAMKRFDDICYYLTNGDLISWRRWERGERPAVRGNTITWARSAKADSTHGTFRRYLDFVFTYAGTASLEWRMLERVKEAEVQAGDFFIQGGFPGHAVLVVDVAKRGTDRAVMLAQSYMPAQQIHILDNPSKPGTPWYELTSGAELVTPEWSFAPGALKRLRPLRCQ